MESRAEWEMNLVLSAEYLALAASCLAAGALHQALARSTQDAGSEGSSSLSAFAFSDILTGMR